MDDKRETFIGARCQTCAYGQMPRWATKWDVRVIVAFTSQRTRRRPIRDGQGILLRCGRRPEQRRDPLERRAGNEVLLLIERVERLLEPELDRRARDQDLHAEIFRRVEGDRASVAVRRRQRVGRVIAADHGDLEAVALEKVAALDALALAVRRVAFQAGEGLKNMKNSKGENARLGVCGRLGYVLGLAQVPPVVLVGVEREDSVSLGGQAQVRRDDREHTLLGDQAEKLRR